MVAGVVFLLIWFGGQKLFVPPPQPPNPQSPLASREREQAVPPTAGPLPPSSSVGAAPPPASTSPLSAPAGAFRVVGDQEEKLFHLGAGPREGTDRQDPEPPYRMRLVLSSVGASIETATLTDHAQRIGDPNRFNLLAKQGDALRGHFRSLAIEKIMVNETEISLNDVPWRVRDPVVEYRSDTGETGEEIAFQLDVFDNDAPALRLTRTFRLPQQSRASRRHDLESRLLVENLSSGARRVMVAYRGGVGIPSMNEAHDDRVIDAGIMGGDARVLGHRQTPSSLTAPGPLVLFTPSPADPAARLAWAAIANTYFTCTVAPVDAQGAPSDDVGHAAAVDLDGSPTTLDDLTLRLMTRIVSLPPDQSITFRSEIYLGEKDGEAFRSHADYKSRNYYFQIAQGFGYCTFSWLVELMILLLNGIHKVLPNFGVAIIILVLIVRTLLHPITKKGQVNLVKMQKQIGELAPKLEEIKKKYPNDKVRAQQESMKLYGEHGINPAGQFLTCLPMLLQMPIWFALYLSLSNNIGMRHAPFVGWIHDLTAPDALYTFASPWTVPIFGWQMKAFNLLPLLVALGTYLQQKLQPKPPPNPNLSQQQREQQEVMQKVMPPMTLVMMLLIFYGMPSGLNLYVAASSFFGGIEQWLIRRHIAHHESAGTFLRRHVPKAPGDGAKGKSFLSEWFQRLQKSAEDAQRLQRSPRAKPKR